MASFGDYLAGPFTKGGRNLYKDVYKGIGRFAFGEPESKEDVYDPDQMQLLQYIMQKAQQGPQSESTFGGGQNFINRILSNDPGAMEDFAAPYLQQFNQEIVPGLAHRFAGMGSGGSQSGSAFTNALGGAAGDLQTKLAALRGEMQLGVLGPALQYAQAPYENLNALGQTALQRSSFQHREGSPGMLPQLLAAIGAGFAGPTGTALGNVAGQGISSFFRPKTKSPSTSLAMGKGGLYPTSGNYNPYTDQMH